MRHRFNRWHHLPVGPTDRTFGERAADGLRHGMGTWIFIFGAFGFMGGWVALNTIRGWRWDPYPFILLNLGLSMLAALQGAILLIAAKRADKIAAELAEYHLAMTKEIHQILTTKKP
jgi:uncharacterized membrane protein